jgi:hypothetical protein
MSVNGRHITLAEQTPNFAQTGIDFVAVDPANHARIFVFFVIDPDHTDLGMLGADFGIKCIGTRTKRAVVVSTQGLNTHTDAQGRNRTVLEINFEHGDSFEEQLLTLRDLTDGRLDPYANATRFSFKQTCPSVFDCGCDPVPTEAPTGDYPVDYLARDFDSYLQAFYAYAGEKYPDWGINKTADQAVMMGEVIAALGDELAYVQDRYALETQFDNLKERRSFAQLTRILGYRLRPEIPASGFVVLRHYEGQTQPQFVAGASNANVFPGTPLKGFGDADHVIPFEVGASLADINGDTPYPTNTAWTDIPAHIPNETCPYLGKGSYSIDVIGHGLLGGTIRTGSKILIETRPTSQDQVLRRFIVTLTDDPVNVDDELLGQNTTRLTWEQNDALDFDLPLNITFVHANLVPVLSGETIKVPFTIGPNTDGLVHAIEREGPASDTCTTRPTIYRVPMPDTVLDGLSWREEAGSTIWDKRFAPEATLMRIASEGDDQTWEVVADMLDRTATDEAATIEAGHWGPVFNYVENGQRREHRDYIGDPGFCLRFGDGEFGLIPAEGAEFELTYRTAHARQANLLSGRIGLNRDDSAVPEMPAEILSVWAPLAFENAELPENIELAKFTVPHFHKARKLRAVRDADFEELLSARTDVQSTLAHTRFTGCWHPTFIATDPIDHTEPDETYLNELDTYVEELRLVGKPAHLTPTDLRPLELKIAICTTPHMPLGNIVEAIQTALTGPHEGAFFHPNRLSFGSRIYRADLEAQITAQTGVQSIVEIQYRWRGELEFQPLTQPYLASAPNQIPVLKHDATRPDLGQLQIFKTAIPTEVS